jgi:N-acetylglucosaminyldiphosphoundecaprenol N-acetyl-beta-D-mannosaminyltransferase
MANPQRLRDTLNSAPPQPLNVLGIPIHPVSAGELVELLVAWGQFPPDAGSREHPALIQRRVYNVNVHAMNLAAQAADFREALQGADLVFCDGFGVKWGAALLGRQLPERMTPPDWIDRFAAATAAAGQRVYALGDEAGIAERFQAMLSAAHPGYQSAGAHHGFFAKEGAENDAVITAINASGATHLLVGFGMPLQERWLEANATRLLPRVLIPVGALFRWYTGEEQRAAPWMTDHGLEWLARLARHPRRHFQRYALGNPRFLARILIHLLRHGRAR